MAHVLVVSTSEPPDIQSKADIIISQTGGAATFQAFVDGLPLGPWSIWVAGVFNLDGATMDFGEHWVRGLGYTQAQAC